MGGLCSKESSPDPFAQPGRTVGSAPPTSTTHTSSVPRKVGGPPQILGGSASPGSQTDAQKEDARRKAAQAAEARANAANKPKGKLGSQLADQKKQTRSDTLGEASKDERRARDADAAAKTRAYN